MGEQLSLKCSLIQSAPCRKGNGRRQKSLCGSLAAGKLGIVDNLLHFVRRMLDIHTLLHFLSRMLNIHTSCWQQSSVQPMVGGGVRRGGTPHQLLLVILLHDTQSSRVCFFLQGSPGRPTPPLAQSARAGFSQGSPGLPAAGTFPALLQLWRT